MLATPSDIANNRAPARRFATATGLAALLLATATATAAGAGPAFAGVPGAGPGRLEASPNTDLPADAGLVSVVVRTDSASAAEAARAAVEAAGGVVGRSFGLIAGFAADVPGAAIDPLRSLPGVAAVTVDAPLTMTRDTWLDYGGGYSSGGYSSGGYSSGGYSSSGPWSDSGSYGSSTVADVADSAGVTEAPLTGKGVGVALIDSGVAPVKGLDGVGKVVNGPDLSFESQAPNLRYLDTFGHGTHMAGIIAGQDPAGGGADRFDGIAPGARLISLKVASAEGATDVSQVIAAIDWVVQHRNDTGLNIRVLNLSFGTDSTQSAALDPMSYAVEQAWKKGIVVVVSVGNDGPSKTKVSMPAANPYVIAVGAADSLGTSGRGDDVVADFTTRGSSSRHADLLANGRSVVSLRNPGSFVDEEFPGARVGDGTDPRFFRGSGTSQSAAVISGAAALLLEQRPELSPDQVKRLLVSTADPVSGTDYSASAGQLDVAAAASAPTPSYNSYKQYNQAATGLGSLEASRGSAHVVDTDTGVALTGETDIFGKAWVPSRWAASSASATSWSGGVWNGSLWTGTSFGTVDGVQTWGAGVWTSRTWSGGLWTSRTWSSAVWTDDGWSSRTWSSRTWASRTWASRTWTAAGWPGETVVPPAAGPSGATWQ